MRAPAVLCVALVWAGSLARAEEPTATVDYARDVRPILHSRCVECHGTGAQESSLRLDERGAALRGGSRGAAIVPGDPSGSRLLSYVIGENPDGIVMPPEGDRLTEAEIATLRDWIAQGADWPDTSDVGVATAGSDHWAFLPVEQRPLPPVQAAAWPKNGIDFWILSRLEAEGLAPSPEADRETLIRRLSLDLLGLPPTQSEVREFLADERPDAYEQLVDRFLVSPHYGERWARHWLDLARYADSDGYEKDNGRPHAWRYRHWVIEALNQDLPFDEFTIEQLAGDLLPNPSSQTLAATGFHRNTLTNTEGGVDQEEFRVAATVDRVNTTFAVWQGLTMGCAQCHNHKYDPFTQFDYYSSFAVFNNLDEVNVGAPLPEQVAEYEKVKAEFEAGTAPLRESLAAYERDVLPVRLAAWEAGEPLASLTQWTALGGSAASAAGATLQLQADLAWLVTGDVPDTDDYSFQAETAPGLVTAIRLEALADPQLPSSGPGRTPHGNYVVSEMRLARLPGDGSAPVELPLARAASDFAQDGFAPEHALDGNPATGWAIAPQFGLSHWLVCELATPCELQPGDRLLVTLLQQHGSQHTLGKFRLSVTNAAQPVDPVGASPELIAALSTPAANRDAAQQQLVLERYAQQDAELQKLRADLQARLGQAPVDPATTTLAQAFHERSPGRETHILIRGDFLRPGALVAAGIPAVLSAAPSSGGEMDRLGFARWLVDPANPLTARVTVNRIWQQHFGRGLVTTLEDFGTQGARPSHPELLDWLAAEFVAQGWSLKQLHKLIVCSATYRQSSVQPPDVVQRDPLNVLLARQSRLRVEAEVIRDLALAASGLLDRRIGGPSVRPPQPEGISELTYAGSARWETSSGGDRYRRGMYTWFQRTSPYPMLMTFDAPESNVVCTRRERSNTPLQALTLLNDIVFVECGQALGRRIAGLSNEELATLGAMDEDAARIRWAFLTCLARQPSPAETAAIVNLLAAARAELQADPALATALAGPADALPLPSDSVAPWVIVARTLLNLDEFITRE